MRSLVSQFDHFLGKDSTRKNLKALVRLLIVLAAMVAVYSVLFHLLMLREGREYSWFTGIYWTLTVMSTLGFGDITFHTDLGRLFSILVLSSGMLFLLVLRPMLKRYARQAPAPVARPAQAPTPAPAAANEAGNEPEPVPRRRRRRSSAYEQNRQDLQDMAQEDPAMVAMIVRNWMNRNE